MCAFAPQPALGLQAAQSPTLPGEGPVLVQWGRPALRDQQVRGASELGPTRRGRCGWEAGGGIPKVLKQKSRWVRGQTEWTACHREHAPRGRATGVEGSSQRANCPRLLPAPHGGAA